MAFAPAVCENLADFASKLDIHADDPLHNPYQASPPTEPIDLDRSTQGGPTSLIVLGSLLLLTEVFATINTIQEGHPLSDGGGFLVLIAGASQVPGLLIGLWRWKKNSLAVVPMLVGAYAIALTGAGVYGLTVFQTEPADSINSAAHMHVIVIPLLHCILAVAVYILCGLVSAGVAFRWLFRRDTATANGVTTNQ